MGIDIYGSIAAFSFVQRSCRLTTQSVVGEGTCTKENNALKDRSAIVDRSFVVVG